MKAKPSDKELAVRIRFTIRRLDEELDYHIRMTKTLSLAIKSLHGEIALIERDWAKLPEEVVNELKVQESQRQLTPQNCPV